MSDCEKIQSTIDRVQRMEQYLDEVLNVLSTCPSSINKNASIREMIEELTDYCESGQWLQDYDCDARGELPADLKRGVLSQDALYDLLGEIRELEGQTKNPDSEGGFVI